MTDTIRKVLPLLAEELKIPFRHGIHNGMCSALRELREKKLISHTEYLEVYNYLKAKEKHRNLFYEIDGTPTSGNMYWWKPKEFRPRINWINKKIKEYDDKRTI